MNGNFVDRLRRRALHSRARWQLRGYRLRKSVGLGRPLRWVLIYGPPRGGTSLMLDMFKVGAACWVGDWNLGSVLHMPPEDREHQYIRYDRAKARQDIGRNILANALPGWGTRYDLAYKQAHLTPQYADDLVQMWGRPRVAVFCLREPSGYMASAIRKWPEAPVATIQRKYVESLATYRTVGGRVFEYGPDVRRDRYIAFLSDLLPAKALTHFAPAVDYRGQTADHLVTAEMAATYRSFLRARKQANAAAATAPILRTASR